MRFFFFCKQKTAYEMRISDWSSDVCSSDLAVRHIASWSMGGQVEAGIYPYTRLARRDVLATDGRALLAGVESGVEAYGQNDGSSTARRSEEHTSELQSLLHISYAVFCLTKKQLLLIHLKRLKQILTQL